jgi:hypothetical protein
VELSLRLAGNTQKQIIEGRSRERQNVKKAGRERVMWNEEVDERKCEDGKVLESGRRRIGALSMADRPTTSVVEIATHAHLGNRDRLHLANLTQCSTCPQTQMHTTSDSKA